MNQRDQIVDYMNQYGSITQIEATNNLGITRLASRISELIEEGYPVKSEFERGTNRFGKHTCYKRYRLEAEK